MPRSLSDPSDPREWLRRARSNLARAEAEPTSARILYEDLCFDAQQAAEKALKAILVDGQVEFAKTHSIRELLALVRSVVQIQARSLASFLRGEGGYRPFSFKW